MNFTLIILGVILLVLIYIMYRFLNKGSIVPKIVTLNSSTTNPDVAFSSLATPNSSRYSLSFWINIESLTGGSKIFTITKGTTDILSIGFTSSATLYYNITGVSSASADHTIITNFPIQKWVYVVLSMDGNVVDMYLDGKMIRSEKLVDPPIVPDKDSTKIVFNKPASDSVIYLAKFERIATAMDPTLAWTTYMAGNGGNSFSNFLSSYGANFTITKDNVDVNKMSLF